MPTQDIDPAPTSRRFISEELVGQFYENDQEVSGGGELELVSDSVLVVDDADGVRLWALFTVDAADDDDSIQFHIQDSNDGVSFSTHTWAIPFGVLEADENRSRGVYFNTKNIHSIRVSKITNGSAEDATGVNLEWRKED